MSESNEAVTAATTDGTDEDNESTCTLIQSKCCHHLLNDVGDGCCCDDDLSSSNDFCPSDSDEDCNNCNGLSLAGSTTCELCDDWMALMNCAIDTERRILRTLDLRRQVLDHRMHRLVAEMQLEKQLLRLAIDEQIEKRDDAFNDCDYISYCLN